MQQFAIPIPWLVMALFSEAPPPLQICLAAAADGSCIYPTTTVPVNLRQVAAVFHLPPNERFTTLTGTWVAVDVGTAVVPGSTVQTESVTNTGGLDHGIFRVTIPRDFPPGKYRLDVLGDGKPWRSAAFTMVAAGVGAQSLAALIPLPPRRLLTYDYRQVAAPGGKITDVPKGATLGPDGALHAVITATVVGTDANGIHLEWRRGGNLFSEEWWRLDATAASVTQRAFNGALATLNPPQHILQWPIDHAIEWDYASADGTVRQHYRAWGPVPVTGPTGTAPGYVVLLEQLGPHLSTTAERHFLPSVGLVRQVIVTAFDGRLAGREEMVLTAAR